MPRYLIACGAALFLTAAAHAQTANPPATSGETLQSRTPQDDLQSGRAGASAPQSDRTLNDTLARQGGVLRPPAPGADPGIRAVPPASGSSSMPVVPAPGTPGGNPSVQPR